MKWMSLGLLAYFLPFLAASTTQPIKAGPATVHEYEGDVGDTLPIGMTLRISSDLKAVEGSYFYRRYCTDIRVAGNIKGRIISIDEFDGEKLTGRFVGEFATVDPRRHFTGDLQTEVIVGHWSKPDGSERRPFYLAETYSGSWSAGKRYEAAGFDDAKAVDRFMSRFRQGILDANANLVASMVRFPIKVEVEGKRVTIENAQDLRRNYDKIFLPGFVEGIRESPTCHMFARDQGVMLGNGQVWVAPVNKKPAVIAINNGLGTH